MLNARPEERRLIIEEAAGVLKYRTRKEKAERRLEATEGNLLRVQDLLREVRRQLRPLERQAEAARRHGDLVAELQALRIFLIGREISGYQTRIATLGRASWATRALRGQPRSHSRLSTPEVLTAEAHLGTHAVPWIFGDALIARSGWAAASRLPAGVLAEQHRGPSCRVS